VRNSPRRAVYYNLLRTVVWDRVSPRRLVLAATLKRPSGCRPTPARLLPLVRFRGFPLQAFGGLVPCSCRLLTIVGIDEMDRGGCATIFETVWSVP
jgi:hypothetical protein